jgi:hypothetical protein
MKKLALALVAIVSLSMSSLNAWRGCCGSYYDNCGYYYAPVVVDSCCAPVVVEEAPICSSCY